MRERCEPWQDLRNYTLRPKVNLRDYRNSEVIEGSSLGEYFDNLAWKIPSGRGVRGVFFEGLSNREDVARIVQIWIEANKGDYRMLMGEGDDEKPLLEVIDFAKADDLWRRGIPYDEQMHYLEEVFSQVGCSLIIDRELGRGGLVFPHDPGELARIVRLWHDQKYTPGFKRWSVGKGNPEFPPFYFGLPF